MVAQATKQNLLAPKLKLVDERDLTRKFTTQCFLLYGWKKLGVKRAPFCTVSMYICAADIPSNLFYSVLLLGHLYYFF